MDLSRTKASNPPSPGKAPGLLDDFRKCIAGYDDMETMKDEDSDGSLSETKTMNGNGKETPAAMNGSSRKRRHVKGDGVQEVTRYNILDGTISHHTELRDFKAALVQQESQMASTPRERPASASPAVRLCGATAYAGYRQCLGRQPEPGS